MRITAVGQRTATGSWSLTGSNWCGLGPNDQVWNNTTSGTAQFGTGGGGSTAYTVTLSQATTAGCIIFRNQAYTLTGSVLTLAGTTTPTITVNATSGAIGSILAGTGGLIKNRCGNVDSQR